MAKEDMVQFNTEQVKRIRAGLAEAKKALQDAKPAYKRVGVFLDSWVQRNFQGEGSFVGGWEDFAAGGRVVNGVLDTSAKLLQDTGALRASFYPFALKDNAGIGSELPYAKKHEEGEGNVPQRRMLPNEKEVGKDIRDILEEYTTGLLDGIRSAFKSSKKTGK